MEIRRCHSHVSEDRNFKNISIVLVFRDSIPSLIHLFALCVLLICLEKTELPVHLSPDIRTAVTPGASLLHKRPQPTLLFRSQRVLVSIKKCIKRGRRNQCSFEGTDRFCKIVYSHRLLISRKRSFKQGFVSFISPKYLLYRLIRRHAECRGPGDRLFRLIFHTRPVSDPVLGNLACRIENSRIISGVFLAVVADRLFQPVGREKSYWVTLGATHRAINR